MGETTQEQPDRDDGMTRLETWHLTRWSARRERSRWIASPHGRDAYIHRRARFHWSVTHYPAVRASGPGKVSIA